MTRIREKADPGSNKTRRWISLPHVFSVGSLALIGFVAVCYLGDFNAPPDDAVFRLLRPRFADAYRRAGVGWGNTIVNDYPVLRIDQIWVSDQFSPRLVYARATEHSDHRMVICDLRLGDPEPATKKAAEGGRP